MQANCATFEASETPRGDRHTLPLDLKVSPMESSTPASHLSVHVSLRPSPGATDIKITRARKEVESWLRDELDAHHPECLYWDANRCAFTVTSPRPVAEPAERIEHVLRGLDQLLSGMPQLLMPHARIIEHASPPRLHWLAPDPHDMTRTLVMSMPCAGNGHPLIPEHEAPTNLHSYLASRNLLTLVGDPVDSPTLRWAYPHTTSVAVTFTLTDAADTTAIGEVVLAALPKAYQGRGALTVHDSTLTVTIEGAPASSGVLSWLYAYAHDLTEDHASISGWQARLDADHSGTPVLVTDHAVIPHIAGEPALTFAELLDRDVQSKGDRHTK